LFPARTHKSSNLFSHLGNSPQKKASLPISYYHIIFEMAVTSTKCSGFLDLPAELRLHIYGSLEVPQVNGLRTIEGFYLSCHQVKSELDHEIGKYIQGHAQHIVQQLDGENLVGFELRFEPTSPLNLVLKPPVNSVLSFMFTFDGLGPIDFGCLDTLHPNSVTLVALEDPTSVYGDLIYLRIWNMLSTEVDNFSGRGKPKCGLKIKAIDFDKSRDCLDLR
jgi:hypothetical protein